MYTVCLKKVTFLSEDNNFTFKNKTPKGTTQPSWQYFIFIIKK